MDQSIPAPQDVRIVTTSARRFFPDWRALYGLILPLGILFAWELLVRFGLIEPRLLPPPSEIGRTVFELAHSGLLSHIGISIWRVACGFSLGALLGGIFGATIGLSRRVERIVDPTFQALRAIPSLAWVPLLLLWLGIGETPKVVLIALGAFFPIYLNVMSGIRNVDAKLIEFGRSVGLSDTALVRRILLPAALPDVFVGLRVGLSLSWMFLVAAELIAASSGIGYLLSEGRETSRPDIVLAAIFLLAVLGNLTDGVLKRVQSRKLAWRDTLDTK